MKLLHQGRQLRHDSKENIRLTPHQSITVERGHLVGGSRRNGEVPKCKTVIVGDTATGKSCLITTYLYNSFAEEYEPAMLDVYRGVKNIGRMQPDLEIHDTSGDENLKQNRKVVTAGADLVILCIATNSKSSFDNIVKWTNEVDEAAPGVPIYLFLTKSDLSEYNEEVSLEDLK